MNNDFLEIADLIATHEDGIANAISHLTPVRKLQEICYPIDSGTNHAPVLELDRNAQNHHTDEIISNLQKRVLILEKDRDTMNRSFASRFGLDEKLAQANLTKRQHKYYKSLAAGFMNVFQDLRPSVIFPPHPDSVEGLVAIKSNEAQKKSVKTDVGENVRVVYQKVNQGFRNGSYAILNTLGDDVFGDISKLMVGAGAVTGIAARQVQRKKKNRAQEAMKSAQEWLSNHDSENLNIFAKYLALEITLRMQGILEVIEWDEIKILAECGYKRLAACLLSGELKPEDQLKIIRNKICQFRAKQEDKLWGYLKVPKSIKLDQNALKARFTPSGKKFSESNNVYYRLRLMKLACTAASKSSSTILIFWDLNSKVNLTIS